RVSAILLPPLMFFVGGGLAEAYFKPIILADPSHGRHIPIMAACGFAMIALCLIMERAAPKSRREFRILATCGVLYSTLVELAFSAGIHDSYYPAAVHLVAFGIVACA